MREKISQKSFHCEAMPPVAVALLFLLTSTAKAQNEMILKSETESIGAVAGNVANVFLENSGPRKESSAKLPDPESTVVETEITMDQMIRPSETAAAPIASETPVPSADVLPAAKEKSSSGSAAESASSASGIEIQAAQVSQLSQSLRRMIDENEKLRQQNEDLDKNLRVLRGQRKVEENRAAEALRERDQMKNELQAIVDKNTKFQEDMRQLHDALVAKEEWLNNKLRESPMIWSLPEAGTLKEIASDVSRSKGALELLRYDMRATEERLQDLQKEITEAETAAQPLPASLATPAAAVTETRPSKAALKSAQKSKKPKVTVTLSQGSLTPASMEHEVQKTEQVMNTLDEISQKNEGMRSDEAKVHYNMGNKFFYAGEYEKAAQEYQAALALRPDDANAHFNLAYVSGEFIKDYKTAEEHYKRYLLINPTASDVSLVKEKLLEAQLIRRAMLNKSSVEKDWQRKRSEIYAQ